MREAKEDTMKQLEQQIQRTDENVALVMRDFFISEWGELVGLFYALHSTAFM